MDKKIISVNKKEINAKQPFIEKISDPLIQKSEWKKSMDKILKEIHDEAASKLFFPVIQNTGRKILTFQQRWANYKKIIPHVIHSLFPEIAQYFSELL